MGRERGTEGIAKPLGALVEPDKLSAFAADRRAATANHFIHQVADASAGLRGILNSPTTSRLPHQPLGSKTRAQLGKKVQTAVSKL